MVYVLSLIKSKSNNTYDSHMIASIIFILSYEYFLIQPSQTLPNCILFQHEIDIFTNCVNCTNLLCHKLIYTKY